MEYVQPRNPKFVLVAGVETQKGKTFQCIDYISTDLDYDDLGGRSIHMVFTMNTLMGNQQFAKRLETIENTYGPGSVCTMSSKDNGGRYTHVKNQIELQGLCFDPSTCPRVVVCCSNRRRYTDGVNFIETLNRSHSCVARVSVYYDEIHKYISAKVRKQIERIDSFEVVESIMGLSASADAVFQTGSGYWSRIKTSYIRDFENENYIGTSDMLFRQVNDFFNEDPKYIRPGTGFDLGPVAKEALEFIAHVLVHNPEIVGDGAGLVFIPGHKLVSSHNLVRKAVWICNWRAVVVVLNGKEKSLQYRDNDGNEPTTISLVHSSEEICETIARVVQQHGLQDRAIIITGQMCVGMGQTFAHPSLGSFTSAILGHLDFTNDDIYQLFGRLTGRMRNWDKYKPTKVYCPKTTMERCIAMETCVKNVAKNHNGMEMTREEFRAPLIALGAEGRSAIDNIRQRLSDRVPRDRDGALRIPIIIHCDKNDKIFTGKPHLTEKIEYINTKTNSDRFRKLHDFITCSGVKRGQITKPMSGNSYKTHITDVINAATAGRVFNVDNKWKTRNNWQCFVDKVGGNLCFCIYSLDTTYLD